MANILKISEAATLALHTMYLLSQNTKKLLSTKDVANMLDVSENHLAKVMQRLVKAGYIESTRGPKGGFKLGKKNSKITLLEVYETIDGPLITTNCLLNTPLCGGANCILGELLINTNKQVKEYLSNKKLSDLS